MKRYSIFPLLIWIFGFFNNTILAQDAPLASKASSQPLLLISVDGLKPEYVEKANEFSLNIPNFRGLWENGAYAKGVRGVLPSITYPSHTTIITGVSPEKHGIYYNQTFDPYFKWPPKYYWFTEDIKVPTLWEAAAENGYKVGSVSWPVSVGAKDIHFNIPEFRAFGTSVDVKITHGFSRPAGLMTEISKVAGEYITDPADPTPRDWTRVRYITEIMKNYEPNFFTVHLTSTDGLQHRNGPFTQPVFDGIEEVDKMIGVLVETFRAGYPDGIVCIVSDHGFAKVDKTFNLYAAFVEEGLITLGSRGSKIQDADIKDWIAMPVRVGPNAAICLKNPEDKGACDRVGKFLEELASVPEYGIASIHYKDDIARLGGTPRADFWVDMKLGFTVSWSLAEPWVDTMSIHGAHGYSPELPEMASTFIIEGKGIKNGYDLGRIDMRNIAPTLAKVLQVSFPTAEFPSLDLFEDWKNEH